MSRLIELGSENLHVNKTDEMTWLRGAYPTNDEGVVEFKTKYPGFYTGRAIHIHTMVSTNWTYLSNGTVISNSGNLRHIGQIFFDEDLNDQVLSTPAYQNSTQTRLPNYRDTLLVLENAHGYNAFADHVMLGDAITDGILAYITIGVDTSFQTSIFTNNTWQPTPSGPQETSNAPKATSANKPVLSSRPHA
ncbi:hypothetical protein FRC08_004037 [Ceratobasidium sp. 394]|nr:hypothetical protein FRC08_004037 [Ceratobasidium sp. 394]